MSAVAWRSAETGRALAYPGDGLLDIFLGLTLLDAWTILRDPPGAVSGGAIVILFPLLLAAKREITVPRLPAASPARPESPPESKPFGVLILLVLFVAAVVLAMVGAGTPSSSAHGGLGPYAWQIVTLAVIACVAVAGRRLRARRFVAYAGLTGIAFTVTLHGRPGLAAILTPALATTMVAWGGVLLARFLAIRPRAA